ncbi:MAG: heme exporter protein CcmB [Bacteroidetes bacterium]|nr:heme exporter protein CcmB [Bacteroidota bacterium]
MVKSSLIFALLRKEILLEYRQKYAFNGIILYVLTTLFLIQISFQAMLPNVWITMLWMVMLFASVNAVAKSFLQEGAGRMLYYYTISSPQNIILSKFLYNAILLSVLALLTYGGFILFFENIVENLGYFLLVLLTGSIGFAASFTMISAIASKAKGSATLMTILSFPIIIPQILLLIKLTKRAVEGYPLILDYKLLLALGGINISVFIVSLLLFPYLWRE